MRERDISDHGVSAASSSTTSNAMPLKAVKRKQRVPTQTLIHIFFHYICQQVNHVRSS